MKATSRRGRRRSEGAAPALALAVQFAVADPHLPTRAQVRRWVRAAQGAPAEVAVRFVDAQEGRELNSRYRGKDYATNVLSFAYERDATVAGDLVLCVPVVRHEAAAQGKAEDAHFAHLIVHGMLHLQGYDHETEEEATVMEGREREIVVALGYPDPYGGEP